MQRIRFRILDKSDYHSLREKLVALYLHAFTTGEFAQHITHEMAESRLDEMMCHGFGIMAFDGDRPVGLLIAFPLEYDFDFPVEACPAIPRRKSVYIAEVMIHGEYRGRGIALQMIENLLQGASKQYSHAVIRVWERNIPALKLYQKLGFTTVANIMQKKWRTPNEEFEMRKIYLMVEIAKSRNWEIKK